MLRLLTLLFLLLAAPALAQTADPYGQLAGDGYAEIEAGVSGLAASGDPRADAILAALSDGRLLVSPDKTLLIRQGSAVVDAKTGAAAADSPDLKPVRANNRVRRAIEAARGQLDLASPDPGKRRAAADAVFKAGTPRRCRPSTRRWPARPIRASGRR